MDLAQGMDWTQDYAAARAQAKGASVYGELEEHWDGEPTGLLVLPHFAGAATPYMDMGSKGVISVLSNVIPAETREICTKFWNVDIAGAAALQC